ncbi:MAG TPA: hypothetical protein VKV40_10995 [Ktedonobacteraceae bacterium]|nr:hypothetical protein [Ktedonobacteraceae bacterium]
MAKGTAASMYLSLYYSGGSIGAILPGFALLRAGWPGVVLLCLGMILVALGADAVLCRGSLESTSFFAMLAACPSLRICSQHRKRLRVCSE